MATEASPFVGRVEELDRLTRGLDAAFEGRPGIVLIGGEAGIGKTRLVRELSDRARERGARALSGGCVSLAEGTLPYLPVAEALRGLTTELGRSRLQSLLADRPELAALVPDVPVRAAEPAGVTSASSRTRLFVELRALIGELAEETPLVLVLEDLHWADGSTLDLIAYLSRAVETERLLVLGTHRTDEPDPGHPLGAWLAESGRTERVETLRLPPLTVQEIADHLAGLTGEAVAEDLVRRIHARSEGNPFFVEELAEGNGERIPESLDALLLGRVRTLSDPALEILRIGAVAGRRFDHGLVAEVAAVPADRLEPALREAVERRLLVTEGDGYAFRHALLQEAVYRALLPGERQRLHRGFAEALGGRGGEDATLLAEEAYHRRAAQDPRALEALVRAGSAALGIHAYPEAHRQLEWALELWEANPALEAAAGLGRAALLALAGDAAGLAGESRRGIELLESALSAMDPRAAPEAAGRIHVRLGMLHVDAGDPGEASFAAFKHGEALLPPEPSAARARASGELALVLTSWDRDEEAARKAREALEIARAAGAEAEMGLAHRALGLLEDDLSAALRYLERAHEIARRTQHFEDLARAYISWPAVLAETGRVKDATDRALEGMAALAALDPAHLLGGFLAGNAMELLVHLGRWDEAEEVGREAAEGGTSPLNELLFDSVLADIAVFRGDLARAREVLARSHPAAERLGQLQFTLPLRCTEAELALWEGDGERAASLADQAVRERAGMRTVSVWTRAVWLALRARADAAEAVGAERERRLEALRAEGRRLVEGAEVDAQELLAGGYLLLARGEQSRLTGELDPAPWARAAEHWRELDCPYPRAYARWRQAEGLLAANRRSEAQEALREGRRIAEELGAGPLREGIEALARRSRLEISEPAGAEEPAPDPLAELGLTEREAEVLRHVAEGRSNREIAEALYISPKTASVHVSNILRKLGVRSRVQAAGVAHRIGLPQPTDGGPT